MIVQRKGGLTEFIPSPQEKREGMIRDHILGLVENLHMRIERLEHNARLPAEEAEVFTALFRHILTDETRNLELHTNMIAAGKKDT